MRITIIPTLGLALCASLACAAADPAPDTPLVKHGDISVNVEDFMAAMARVPEAERIEFRSSLERVQKTVDGLYLMRSLAHEASVKGIDQEPEVRARLRLAQEQALAQVYLERLDKAIKVPDFEARAREMYEVQTDKFTKPERVKLQHILVETRNRTRERALPRIEEARRRLLAGENFFTVSREFNEDPAYRATQGEIGPAPYAQITPVLADAARKMKPGDVSDIIEADDGFHVIVLTERLKPEVVPFASVKKELVKAEEVKYRRAEMDKKFGEFTVGKDVVVYTDNIAALKTQLPMPDMGTLQQRAAGATTGKP